MNSLNQTLPGEHVSTDNDSSLTAHHRTLSRHTLNELHCYLSMQPTSDSQHCEPTWDGLSCWPRTALRQSASIPCFEELRGIAYDTTKNATRVCLFNGNWAERADYSKCAALLPEEEVLKRLWNISDASTIYQIGYGASLVALAIALAIFVRFQELGCMRNRIHTHLIATYLLMDVSWMIAASLQSAPTPSASTSRAQCLLFITLTYLTGTNFFWMFVEGLYLYLLVVQTFTAERFKWPHYALIGWGVPSVLLAIWLPLKYAYAQTGSLLVCPWSERDFLDYVFILPILIVLALNVYFLLAIMFVLITKLRASTSAESRQYRKAAKALLVLIPLLGLTYVLLLVIPASGYAKVVFTYLQAALYSTQGLLVAVLYCFLNGEVRQCLRLHVSRWRTHRLLSARPATSARGSNASHTTAADGSTRNNSFAFTPPLDSSEMSTELRVPLRHVDPAKLNVDFRHSSVDIRGRTRPILTPKSGLSISKRLINFFHRCRPVAKVNRTYESKITAQFDSQSIGSMDRSRMNPAMAVEEKLPLHCITSNAAKNQSIMIDSVGDCGRNTSNVSFTDRNRDNDNGSDLESACPLNLTTKISIEINCNQKPLYSYSPVQVTYSERRPL